jgi:hypothetical protein
MGKREGKK